MKKEYKYLIGVVIAGLVIYNSVYFRPLDEKQAAEQEIEFSAGSFVDEIWPDILVAYDSAIDINVLADRLHQDLQSTFEEEANALGIGNIGYFKVMGEGIVQSVEENHVIIKVGERLVEIETEFIFGNAVRDASGLIRINDYDRTSDFNSISETINEKVRNQVIPDFKRVVKKGDEVFFKGAVELNKSHLDISRPEIIPVSLQINPTTQQP